MANGTEIKDILRKIAGTDIGGDIFFNAKVTEVKDETCTIEYIGLLIDNVRLSAVVDGNVNNLLIVPKKNSMVLVADLSEGNLRDLAIIGWTEIESISINGGINEGLVKVIALTDKLNAIENDINDLKSVFSSWTPISNDGGAALKTAIATWMSSTLDVTNKADIQNEKIKH